MKWWLRLIAPARALTRAPRRRTAALFGLLLGAGLAGPGQAADQPDQLTAVQSALASKALLTDSARAGKRIVAVGAYGNIVYSDDGGEHWQQAVQVPTQVLLTAVTFIDERNGWAAGHDSLILRTRDGGVNWEIVYQDPVPAGDVPKPILDIRFSDPLHGVAVGAFAFMLITADGGEHWQVIDTAHLYDLLEAAGLEPEPNFNAVAARDDGFLIAGELGTLLFYRPGTAPGNGAPDGPASPWRILPSPYRGSFFGVDVLRSGELLIYGLRGHCYRSRDGGNSWSEIPTDTTANLYATTETEAGDLIVVGAGGTLLRLPSGGGGVERIPYGGFNGFASVQRLDDRHLLLFGDAGAQRLALPDTP